MTTNYVIAEKILRIGSPFLLLGAAAKNLSAVEFGNYALCVMITSISVGITTAGIDTILLQSISRRGKLSKAIFFSSQIASASTGLIWIAVVGTTFYQQHEGINNFILPLTTFILINSINRTDAILQGGGRFKESFILHFVLIATLLPIKYWDISVNKSFEIKLMLDVLEQLVAILYVFLAKSHYKKGSKFGARAHVLIFSALAFPLWANGVLLIGYQRIDQIFLTTRLTIESLGVYSLAVTLNSLPGIVIAAHLTAWFPKMISMRRDDPQQYEALIKKIAASYIFISAAYLILVMLFAEILIVMVFGDAMRGAAEVLQIISFSIIFVSFGQIAGQYALLERMYWLPLKRSLLTLCIAALLLLSFYENLDLVRIAWVSVCVSFIANFLAYAFFSPVIIRNLLTWSR
jgi:O-antigen/teichoic acid export membrane protein